jgi:acetoin utilization deacetylase AcuC-like enzyme
MGGSVATMSPEGVTYNWAAHDGKDCDTVTNLQKYGRSTCNDPIFPGEPSMCRCCPRYARFRPPNGETSHIRYQLDKLKTVLQKKHKLGAKVLCGQAFSAWQSASGLLFSPTDKKLDDLKTQLSALNKRYERLSGNVEQVFEETSTAIDPVYRPSLAALPTTGKSILQTALVYDQRMCNHADVPGCEISERISRIHNQLEQEGLSGKCTYVEARLATDGELLAVHTAAHIKALDALSTKSDDELREFERKLNSISVNQSTAEAARLAAGSLVDLCLEVYSGNTIQNGFAVIRPPGHHCESCTPFGFCLYSNVAIAIRAVQTMAAASEAPIPKVMVVDWDVHHGNSTQHQFWHDPNVFYFSIHRYDDGRMFPGTPCADLDRIGGHGAKGYNCNVPFSNYDDKVGDAEYMYAWEKLLIPLTMAFQPDLIVVSCGFDSARGDPLGQFDITPLCYAHMTRTLQQFASGKVVLALEGGYNLESISASGAMCVRALLGEPLEELQFPKPIDQTCVRIIDDCVAMHEQFLLKR